MGNVLETAAAIGLIGVAMSALTKWVALPMVRLSRKAADFFSDWNGEPARPGHEARRGVMERLAATEYSASRAEWHLGNGTPEPIRALVVDTQAKVSDIEKRLGPLESTVTREHGPFSDREN